MDGHGRSLGVRINDKGYDDPVTECVKLGSMEKWRFINTTDDAHPMHLHLVQFQILERQGFNPAAFAQASSNYVGSPRPPAANEAGWKDTAVVNPRDVLTILVRFEGYTGRYVYHCHMLEHEDNDMMRPYEVVSEAQALDRCNSRYLRSSRVLANGSSYTQRLTAPSSSECTNCTQRLGGDWGRRSRRRSPWNIVEVEEVQQVGLRGIAGSQVRGGTDKPVLDKLDHRRMIHRNVRNIVPPGERRDDHVRARGSRAERQSRATAAASPALAPGSVGARSQ